MSMGYSRTQTTARQDTVASRRTGWSSDGTQARQEKDVRTMTPEVARRMNRLNEDFYRDNARSFDQTRQGAWPGWEH